jgi:Mg-chelatase subunit ChlD
MKFDDIKNVPCIGEKPVEVVDDPQPTVEVIESTKCVPCEGDMEWAALVGTDHCVNPPTIEKLYILPESMSGASYGTVQYDAYIQFKYHPEGTTCPSDVTEKVSWTSSNTDLATSEGGGVFKLGRVDTATTLTVTASYTPTATVAGVEKKHTEELFATASLVVKPECKGVAVDIVLVVDRSGSMLKKDQSGGSQTSRLEAAKKACELLALNSKIEGGQGVSTEDGSGNYERDRIAIVTYAGSSREGGNDGKRAEVHSGKFLEHYDAVKASAERIQVAEECKGKGRGITGCWTGMGYGLQTAYDLLQAKEDGGDARETATEISTSPRKLIILLTDGHENVCDPDPILIAGDIRKDRTGGDQSLLTVAHDTMIAVVGYLLDSGASIKRCNGTTTTVGNYLSLVANCYGKDSQGDSGAATALTYFPQNEAELKEVYQGILDTICVDSATQPSAGPCHYIEGEGLVSSDVQPVIHFQYEGFKNWIVCKNSVDWMGGNLWANLIPTAGRYVGLIGFRGGPQLTNSPPDAETPAQSWPKDTWDTAYEQKNCQIMTAPYDHNFGGIETITEFDLEQDKQYKLTIQYAGNGTIKVFPHGNDLNSSIRITVGGEQSGAAWGTKVVQADVEHSLEKADGIPMTVTANIDPSACALMEVVTVKPDQKLTSDALVGTIESIVDPTPTGAALSGDWQADKTWPAFLATSTNGSGTGAKYKVVTDENGKPEFTRKDGGTGYVATNTLTFTDPGNTTNTAVITVGVAKDVESTHYIRRFFGRGSKMGIRIEQYPKIYKEYINPGNKKYISYDIPDEDFNAIFTELQDSDGNPIPCSANRRIDLTDFGGFTSYEGLPVYGEENKHLRHQTSGADEFLANSPYGVNISNVKLEELDAAGDPLSPPLFNDDFSA